MRNLVLTSALIASLALLAVGSASSSLAPASSTAVTIDSVLTSPSSGLATATFVATLPLCPAGTMLSTTDAKSGQTTQTFTCADGSGTFTLKLQDHAKKMTWSIASGTGSYANSRGSGIWVGEVLSTGDPAIVHYSYVGKVASG